MAGSDRDRDREKNRVRMARLSAERKAEGRCVDCGQPVQDGRSRCVQCASRNILYGASLRKRRRESGLCQHCGIGVPETGKSMCVTCLILRSRPRRTCKALQRDLRDLRQRKREAVAEGRCRNCTRNPAVPGRGGRCDRCADRANARRRELKAAKREALVKETPF